MKSPLALLSKFVPVESISQGHWRSAGLRVLDGAIYVIHANKFAEFGGNEYFEPIPLSQFCTAVEAAEKQNHG